MQEGSGEHSPLEGEHSRRDGEHSPRKGSARPSEGNPKDILQFFISGGSIQLSDLDPRFEGDAAIPRFNSGVTRFELVVNGGVKVEGRELEVGERVRITTGGKIFWNP